MALKQKYKYGGKINTYKHTTYIYKTHANTLKYFIISQPARHAPKMMQYKNTKSVEIQINTNTLQDVKQTQQHTHTHTIHNYIYIHINIYEFIYQHTYICMYVYVCMYMCVFV